MHATPLAQMMVCQNVTATAQNRILHHGSKSETPQLLINAVTAEVDLVEAITGLD
jgi:hypothetical protein